MPIFEFECAGCGHRFEEIVLGSRDEPVACPSCGGQTRKLMSTFSWSGTDGAHAASSCSSCSSAGTHACSSCSSK